MNKLITTRLQAFVVALFASAAIMSLITSVWPGQSVIFLVLTIVLGTPIILNTTVKGITRARAGWFGFFAGWIFACWRDMYYGSGVNAIYPF